MGLWEGQRKMFSNKLFTISQSLLGRLLLRLPRAALLDTSLLRLQTRSVSPPGSSRDLGQAAAANGGN